MTVVNVLRYQTEWKTRWNEFVSAAKNGVFLFHRDYQEYHADRFPDASLLFIDDSEELIALMPATRSGSLISSHNGLTFGGIISRESMKAGLMLDLFDALLKTLRAEGVEKLIYKVVPHIYHRLPAEEDLYALFRNDATLIRRDVSSTLDMGRRLPFSKGRRWAIKQAQKSGIAVARSYDFTSFMRIEEQLLNERHDAQPVHTAAEIELLASRFRDNIKLFAAHQDKRMLAGIVIYESNEVAHAQYIGATEEGRACGASDLIVDYLLHDYYANKRYFDFGISTEDNGRYLNEGLIENKQGFGGRATVYDTYEVQL